MESVNRLASKRCSTASEKEPDHITEIRESLREPICADSQKDDGCNHNKDPYLPDKHMQLTKA